jgi:hypothetical protein
MYGNRNSDELRQKSCVRSTMKMVEEAHVRFPDPILLWLWIAVFSRTKLYVAG